MRKTILILGIASSLLFARTESTTFKRADDTNSNNSYNSDRNNDQVRVNGYVSYIRDWRDYSVIEIKQKQGRTIKARVEPNLYLVDDIVSGTCVNYRGGEYQRCSLYRR